MSCSGLHRYIFARTSARTTERKRIVFDGKRSWIHFLLGMVSGVFPIIGLVIASVYLVYQLKEQERYVSKLGDFIEFIFGYVIGDTVEKLVKVF